MIVFGTRPDAVKMAPVVRALRAYPEEFTPIVAVTAQHREMLDQVLALFAITPDHDLGIMTERQSLAEIAAAAQTAGLDYLLVENLASSDLEVRARSPEFRAVRAEMGALLARTFALLPEEVAAAILWLGSACPEYLNGTTLDVNNGSYPR